MKLYFNSVKRKLCKIMINIAKIQISNLDGKQ